MTWWKKFFKMTFDGRWSLIEDGLQKDNIQRKNFDGRQALKKDNLCWKKTSASYRWWPYWWWSPMKDNLQWRTGSNGIWPLVSDDFWWKTKENLSWKATFHGIHSSMEKEFHGRQPRMMKADIIVIGKYFLLRGQEVLNINHFHCLHRGQCDQFSSLQW